MKKKILAIVLAAIMMLSAIYVTGISFKDYTSTPTKMVSGSWEQDNTGWWYKYPDGSYPKDQWLEIKDIWYYFDTNGYMEYDCYRDCYWLNSDGAYVSGYYGSWQGNVTIGWWWEDGSWYPTNYWLKIDGYWYHFDSTGYLDVDTWIGDYYVDKDGKWIKDKVKPTDNGGGGNGGSGTGGSGTGNGGNGTGGNGGEKPVACSHEFVVIKANTDPVMQKQRNADGTIRLHSICNGCHRDLTVIADNKMWEQEDLGGDWSSTNNMSKAQDWHFLKYGCECLGYDTSRTYDVLAPLPPIYKCSKCGAYKYVPSTGVNYYKMQNGQITDADYVINKNLDNCNYYYGN